MKIKNIKRASREIFGNNNLRTKIEPSRKKELLEEALRLAEEEDIEWQKEKSE